MNLWTSNRFYIKTQARVISTKSMISKSQNHKNDSVVMDIFNVGTDGFLAISRDDATCVGALVLLASWPRRCSSAKTTSPRCRRPQYGYSCGIHEYWWVRVVLHLSQGRHPPVILGSSIELSKFINIFLVLTRSPPSSSRWYISSSLACLLSNSFLPYFNY